MTATFWHDLILKIDPCCTGRFKTADGIHDIDNIPKPIITIGHDRDIDGLTNISGLIQHLRRGEYANIRLS